MKQPPVIDPRTGQEVILEPEGPTFQDTDDSDDSAGDSSDIEAEYFEAEVRLKRTNAKSDVVFKFSCLFVLSTSVSVSLK